MKRWVSFGCGTEKVGIARVENVVPTVSPPNWVLFLSFCAIPFTGFFMYLSCSKIPFLFDASDSEFLEISQD